MRDPLPCPGEIQLRRPAGPDATIGVAMPFLAVVVPLIVGGLTLIPLMLAGQ